jgi:hypothetical protein
MFGVLTNNPMHTNVSDNKKARLNVGILFERTDNVDIMPDDFQDFIDENKLKKIDLVEANETNQKSKPVYMVNDRNKGAAYMVGKANNANTLTRDYLQYYTPITTGGSRIRRKSNKNKKTIKKNKSKRKTYRKTRL